ncbi:MAG TPA: hypothetical protein VL426_07915 [Candidatus Binatia bacterium]|nr:hypothetical protein [Candidatus Binatia bacterium]
MRHTTLYVAKVTAAAVLAATLVAPVRALGAETAPVSTDTDPWVITTLARDAGDVRIEAYKADKHLVAWTETSGTQRKLYAYDGAQIRTLAAFDKNDWKDDGNGFYDAVTGNFDVADGMVVWTMNDGNDREIYAFDGESVKKVSDNSYDDRHPIVSNGRVAWTSQPSGSQYNLMVKDRFGMRLVDSWPVLDYAFSGSNLFWLNKRPNEDWFRVFVNGGLASGPVGKGDDRAIPGYFVTDGKGSAAWEYSTKQWSYDKREIYVSVGGAKSIMLIQRDVPPMVTRLEDMDDGKIILNVTDLLYTKLSEKSQLMEIAGSLVTNVYRKPVPTKVRYMDGGYVRHREPDANTPIVFHAADGHEDFITLDAVILDRFDADGGAAAGARVGGGLVTWTGGKAVTIPSSVETSSLDVKNGDIAWIEGRAGSQTLKFATTPVLVKTAYGARSFTGHLVKGSGSNAVYLAAADGKRYVFAGESQYFSWFRDFDTVETLSNASLSAMPLGGNVLYRPGSRLLKAASSPKVYAVGKDGSLHWVTSESVVLSVFGPYWKQQVDIVNDGMLADYTIGSPINEYGKYYAAMTN